MPPPVATTVYELTETGAALRPAITELIRWGGRFLLPPRRGERFDPRWLMLALGACARTNDSPPHTVQLLIPAPRGDVAVHLGGGPQGTVVEARVAPAALTVRGDARAVFALATGMHTPADLLASGQLDLEGDRSLVNQVPLFFDTSGTRSEKPGRTMPPSPRSKS